LESIEIPSLVTYIGNLAFDNCLSLKSVKVEKDSYAEKYMKDNGLEELITY
jgi:hypothetical protein